ncbi:hypothetical protein MLD38_010148 [Melastoma candidum]|uniref:Uncharacterized protein n=1 Tax=Melastoma candidum TaxID=119954 RepID=A0ACB9QZ29_9MYRT|nr:hypothetical protein MLD38_010148 [Melastoma candidum]
MKRSYISMIFCFVVLLIASAAADLGPIQDFCVAEQTGAARIATSRYTQDSVTDTSCPNPSPPTNQRPRGLPLRGSTWGFLWEDRVGGIFPNLFEMVAQEFTVELNKPLVFQVGHLGENYQEWVHQPIVSKEGPRFFESDFWEFLTRTKWWVIPLVWLPVVCWCISMSVKMGHTSYDIALLVGFGIFIWTLLEYSLHRFLFHIKTKSYWGNTAHYLIHGCHHKHPMDGLRLVFPPAATAVLLFPFWNAVSLLATPSTTPALFGGGLLGYVMYDCTHYYLHHGQPSGGVSKDLKKYHLNHHFRIQDKGFGITSSFWDKVFGTLPQVKQA